MKGIIRCGYYPGHFKRVSNHPLAILKRMRQAGVTVTPYDTNERRVIGRKIYNVEYHKIDWAKCFRGCDDLS